MGSKVNSMEEDIYISEAVMKKATAEQKLKEVIASIKEFRSENINMDLMGNLLLDLPINMYHKTLENLNILEEILSIQKKLKIIEDNAMNDVNKLDLKNQTQRDAEQRRMLLDNETYLALNSALVDYQKAKNVLQAQIEYYDKLLSGVKIKFRHLSAIQLCDKNLEKEILNG
jgi:hypothetical protein